MDSCVLARKKTPVNHVEQTYFIAQNVTREKAGNVPVGGTLNTEGHDGKGKFVRSAAGDFKAADKRNAALLIGSASCSSI